MQQIPRQWPEHCAACAGPCRYPAEKYHDPSSHYFAEEYRPKCAPPHAVPRGGFHWRWFVIIHERWIAEVGATRSTSPITIRYVSQCTSAEAAQAALRLLTLNHAGSH